MLLPWYGWALLSAGFAALTAILAKLGLQHVDPDVATLVRTVVILALAAAVVGSGGKLAQVGQVPSRAWTFLVLSGLATGASWLCYFRALDLGDAARVAPLDKLSVVLVALFAVSFLGERLAIVNWLGIVMIAAGAVLVGWRG